jgi:hypothetical protein
MAKKRLAFDVEEDLHSLLKQKAAEQNISLSVYCSGLLELGLNAPTGELNEVDPSLYASLPLDQLRSEATRLGSNRAKDWETLVRKINAEIVRRYVS